RDGPHPMDAGGVAAHGRRLRPRRARLAVRQARRLARRHRALSRRARRLSPRRSVGLRGQSRRPRRRWLAQLRAMAGTRHCARRRQTLRPAGRPRETVDAGARRAGVPHRAEFPRGLQLQPLHQLHPRALPSRRPDPRRSAIPPTVPRRRAAADARGGQGNPAPAQRAGLQDRRHRRPHRQRYGQGHSCLSEENRHATGRRLCRPEGSRPVAPRLLIRLDAGRAARRAGTVRALKQVTTAKRESTAASTAADPTIAAIDRPRPAGVNAAGFGSDVAADALRALDIPYIALNPGASYRGFHDSIVNYLGNERPQMLLCLHEESAIAIAHGWAKVTGRAMAVAVHSNVGLMHATMGVFNAWCDRMPIVMLGATGPVDATIRRPWIDWIHTASDQGALIRGYSKWDDQPASPAAAREAILRAAWIANTAPCGPTYVNLDAGMQEAKLEAPVPPIDTARFMPEVKSAPPQDMIAKAAALLHAAKNPVILAGRVSRDPDDWTARVALAERLGAR